MAVKAIAHTSPLPMTPKTVSVSAEDGSVVLLMGNSNRRALTVDNRSSGALLLGFSFPVTDRTAVVRIPPMEFLPATALPPVTGAVYARFEHMDGFAQVTEYC